MGKISKQYLKIDPYKIIEEGFHKDRDKVSESIFSLGNEYSGVRGFFDEDYSGNKLIGTYFNGIYDYALSETPNAYKGIVKRTHFTINSTNFLKCHIQSSNEVLDLNVSEFEDFYRELDMKSGLYTRSFVWLVNNTKIKITFKRLLNMTYCHEAIQQITFETDKDISLDVSLCLDLSILHWNSDCYFKEQEDFVNGDIYGISGKTLMSNQSICSAMKINCSGTSLDVIRNNKEVSVSYKLDLKANTQETITRYVINLVDKKSNENIPSLINQATNEVKELANKGFEKSLKENTSYFEKVWENSDIIIEGDEKNQQGIRYCIFQLEQTYHGYEKDNNIGAKGLTGEAYSGHAFWDSETYCLPFYLFSNQEASKNLLMFRYNTLNEAKERAKALDCIGACYPIATRNGKEGCNLWQHASLQLQPSTAVFYAIFHYMNLYHDHEFMQNYGIEMIMEIAKFLLTRGQYNQDRSKFSFYGVMGPDEFQLMVNHNTYTNYMAKKTFDYLLELLASNEYEVEALKEKCQFDDQMIELMKDASKKMIILYDENTGLYEQNAGFFDMPHIDINKIPQEEFPLYSHWTYDRIYRNDMIKQPDVLMFMFLYNQDFTLKEKLANYEYYEPRCIHESSLSPSIHSIFACELNKKEEALKFFEFATRLDLDDYNNNSCEGIHTTSIAAAWMNIVYGFGGLRSDRETLSLNPTIVSSWKSYSFNIKYHEALINVKVDSKNVFITTNKEVNIKVYGSNYTINQQLVLECQ